MPNYVYIIKYSWTFLFKANIFKKPSGSPKTQLDDTDINFR